MKGILLMRRTRQCVLDVMAQKRSYDSHVVEGAVQRIQSALMYAGGRAVLRLFR